MAALSDYAEKKLLDHILGLSAYTMPTCYAALFTDDPADDASGTEVSGGSYARVEITSKMNASGATDGHADNNAAITFGPASASWGTVTHFAIFDASTAGNLLLHGAFSASKVIGSGDSLQIASGELDITFA